MFVCSPTASAWRNALSGHLGNKESSQARVGEGRKIKTASGTATTKGEE
jgi:hypothetical protein